MKRSPSNANGPQATVSKKTQVSVSSFKKGMERLYKNVMDVNSQFVDDMLLEKLLTYICAGFLEQFARNL